MSADRLRPAPAPLDGRRLRPTPAGPDGAPPTVPTTCLPDAPTDEALAALAAAGTPILGAVHDRDGQRLREATFLHQAPSGYAAAVHLNSLTDRHREDLTGSLLTPIPGTRWYHRSYLLPDDGTFSYRLVAQPHLPLDLGTTRPGWLQMHQWGMPDPHNPLRLPNPLGEESSLYCGPSAPTHPEWDGAVRAEREDWSEYVGAVQGHGLRLWFSPERRAERLLVLLDGANWQRLGARAGLAGRARAYDILLLDTGSGAERGEVLPHPERISAVVAQALAVAATVSGRRWQAPQVVVAGQSFGGLAAASIVALFPELAVTAVAQSGSYWFQAGVDAFGRGQGDLWRRLEGSLEVQGRFILQVGSEEGDMVAGSRAVAELLSAAGGQATLTEFVGGHDYAWWRHGLSRALDDLESPGER